MLTTAHARRARFFHVPFLIDNEFSRLAGIVVAVGFMCCLSLSLFIADSKFKIPLQIYALNHHREMGKEMLSE